LKIWFRFSAPPVGGLNPKLFTFWCALGPSPRVGYGWRENKKLIMTHNIKSKIEVNSETGKKCLIVYYDSEKSNYSEAIKAAQQYHNTKSGQIATIALPTGFSS
jgi:hypothetical protein